MPRRTIHTPFGPLEATANDRGVTHLRFVPGTRRGDDEHPLLDTVEAWLTRYVADPRTPMDLPLAPDGTAFQHAVWNALLAIPPGQTCTYGALARAIERPGAVRAVGRANGANPIALLIPCHRVVASDRSLHGYAAGLDTKRRLLAHEGALDPLFRARPDGACF
ncbi:MAG: methylated-DNA--[protein]-cysteine S-methyltransferase [Phycisphaerales bacterium]